MTHLRFLFALLIIAGSGLALPLVAAPLRLEQIPPDMRAVENPPPAAPASVNEAIMGQIARCWTAPENAEMLQNVPPPILNVVLNKQANATAINLDPKTKAEFEKNPGYRDLVMSAILAVKNCMPLQGLPIEEYEKWRTLQLVFGAPPPMQ